jgi:diaminopimelate epimerase
MSEEVRVWKMSGAGNDFVMLDAETARRIGDDLVAWIRAVCRRGLSLGADGVTIVEPAGAARVRVRYHNPDGSVAFCANASRCAARLARQLGFGGESLLLETAAGEVPAEVLPDGVRLHLPPPRDAGRMSLDLGEERLDGRWVEAGVPHFLHFVDRLADAPLARWGPRVRRHPRFGEAGTNLDLVLRRPDGSLALRTWERGVEGETLACGSGAVAAAFAVRLEGGPETVRVEPASGVPLQVILPGPARSPRAAILVGDARFVFEGRVHREATCGT